MRKFTCEVCLDIEGQSKCIYIHDPDVNGTVVIPQFCPFGFESDWKHRTVKFWESWHLDSTGGCTARTYAEGDLVYMVTDVDGCSAPEQSAEFVMFGLYEDKEPIYSMIIKNDNSAIWET